MTPAEIKGRIKAREIAQKQAMLDADLMAWMIGHYASFGFHDPKNYPKSAHIIQRDMTLDDVEMEPEDMKDALTIFAQTHNAVEGAKHGNHT